MNTCFIGPYIVYMLKEMDILEDWAAIRKVSMIYRRHVLVIEILG